MTCLRLAALGALVAGCAFTPPAFADEMKNGMMMMVTPDGKTTSMTVDKAQVDMMMKYAHEVKDGMAIFVWGSKLYTVNNEKMSNGQMTFNVWGFHTTK